MDIGAILRMVLAAQVDADTRQALLRALDGDTSTELSAAGDEEADGAIEALARALGVLDEAGEVDEEAVRELAEQAGLEA
jgi:hypothetical protein